MKPRALLAMMLFMMTVAAISGCNRSQPSPTPTPQPLASDHQLALETEQLLRSFNAPQRDLVDLATRFGNGQTIPRMAREEPWGFAIGDGHDFWVQDKGTGNYRQVTAELAYETPHAYWFVVGGRGLGEQNLARAAERFEGEVYPTNQRLFGREWSPGVDSDPHLVILLTGSLGGGVSAYQNSLDEVPRTIFPLSNEMEMITISAEESSLAEPAFTCILAHEFQHVIQWANDRDEKTWLNEVFGLLACPLNDLEADYSDLIVAAFAEAPDIQLNVWGTDPDRVAAQYGASQLYGAYFLERFGEQGVQVLAADPQNGLRSIDSALQSLDTGLRAGELFADWVAANYLDDPELADGRFGYRDIDVPRIAPAQVIDAGSLPLEIHGTVSQYAADYITINGPGQFLLDFNGELLVRPVPADPHSGNFVWWAGREQESDATLGREFDLTGLNKATLTFYAWYDIDEGFDHAYVALSTDGRQWTALPGQTTSTGHMMGVELGPGYTGRSDGWIQERIDLTPYAGQIVQLRFEYVTDDGPVRPGFLLDDIEIPELGYHHNAETDDGGWLANGFVRQANILPQEWLLQLITTHDDPAPVERLTLDPDKSGRWQIDLATGETAVLAISGLTRDTTEAAGYWLRVAEAPG
jgi:hypothetical protein